jgi:hypothetical protein
MNRPGDSDTVTLLFDEQEEVADEEVVEVDKKLTNHYAFPILVRRLPFTKEAKVKVLLYFSGTVAHQISLKGTVNEKVGHLFEYLSLSDEEKLSKLSAIELAEYIVTLIMALERSDNHRDNDTARPRLSKEHDCIEQLRIVARNCVDHCTSNAQSSIPSAKHKATTTPGKLPHKTINGGRLVQSTKMFSFVDAQKEQPCASCGNQTINALDTEDYIADLNDAVKLRLASEMKAYIAGGNNGKKPRTGKYKSARLACYATTQFCCNRPEPSVSQTPVSARTRRLFALYLRKKDKTHDLTPEDMVVIDILRGVDMKNGNFRGFVEM